MQFKIIKKKKKFVILSKEKKKKTFSEYATGDYYNEVIVFISHEMKKLNSKVKYFEVEYQHGSKCEILIFQPNEILQNFKFKVKVIDGETYFIRNASSTLKQGLRK